MWSYLPASRQASGHISFCFLANMIVVKIDGEPELCRTDEVGELCVCANYTGWEYWGLKGFSSHVFRVSATLANLHRITGRVDPAKELETYVSLGQTQCP